MEEQIISEIRAFVEQSGKRERYRPMPPLVCFAGAGDPLFPRLKDIISPTHALPADLLPGAETVIAYFIPFDPETEKSNRTGKFSSVRWAEDYIETNKMIAALNDHLLRILEGKGFRAAFAPATHNFKEEVLLSDWSHRSVAYIAGLGTFGVNRMVITELGCCGRFGSLVTDLALKPTDRPAGEYCLYKADGSCKKCVKRCVNGSLHLDSYDRFLCRRMTLANAKHHEHLESIADVCGKCLTLVPCATGIPVKSSP